MVNYILNVSQYVGKSDFNFLFIFGQESDFNK